MRRRSRGALISHAAGFQVSTTGRFWVSSERQREDGLDTLPARAAEANRSTLIAYIPFPAPENVAAKQFV